MLALGVGFGVGGAAVTLGALHGAGSCIVGHDIIGGWDADAGGLAGEVVLTCIACQLVFWSGGTNGCWGRNGDLQATRQLAVGERGAVDVTETTPVSEEEAAWGIAATRATRPEKATAVKNFMLFTFVLVQTSVWVERRVCTRQLT